MTDELDEYVPFVIEDYIKSPVAVARINSGISRKELALRMGLSLDYLGRLERKGSVTPKFMERVHAALKQ
jgi:transcriptional regulator with XRE-family HTH domain